MAHRLTSALLFCLAAGMAHAQAFGRFGYTEAPHQGGIACDRAGFAALQSAADRFTFSHPSRLWRPLETTAFGQTVLLSGGSRLPVKARFNLLAPGPEYYFESGLRLDLGSTGAPYLSWSDGSAGQDIPTPDVSWVLVSFKNAQPPVLLAFPDGKVSLTLSGKPGDWHIVSDKPFRGWLRIVLPFGTEPIATGGAAGLGKQTVRLAKSLDAWMSPSPQPRDFSVHGDSDGVTATWTFGGTGAILPPAALLAPAGGYALKIKSKYRLLDGETEEGPRAALLGDSLTIECPIKRIPNGRALAIGAKTLEAPGTISAIDIPSVVDLALSCMLAERESALKKLGDDTLASYLADAEYLPEPSTSQSLPYGPDGHGLDLTAAQALLMQALSLSTRPSSEENSLLTSIEWRKDWDTWRFDIADEKCARRTSALGAVAGAFCPEPSRRLQASMLEAGLAAQRAQDSKRAKAGTPAPPRIEPLSTLRAEIFGDLPGHEPFGKAILSHTRAFGEDPISVEKTPKGFLLIWDAPDTQPHVVTLVSSYPLKFKAPTLKSFDVSSALGTYSLKMVAKESGRIEILLTLPAWAPPLPVAALPQPYGESALPASPH